MFWVLSAVVVWLAVGLGVGVVIGRGIRLADQREREVPADIVLAGNVVGEPGSGALAPGRRPGIPLPPVGVAIAAFAVALETTGFVLRLRGSTWYLLSMDAPLSLPRMYVSALFAAAGLTGFAGARVLPGRRSWWAGVGLVGALISAVKLSGVGHADALHALDRFVGPFLAQVVSVLLAVGVIAGLWFLSRSDRRDRGRVLGSLAGYAVAAVGLSALSSMVTGSWAAAATYLEESGEALGGVAFLMAVLVGVAPRVILPAGWPLRRAVDAQTLDLPDQVRGRAEGTTAG